MRPATALVAVYVFYQLLPRPVVAQTVCTFRQVTDFVDSYVARPSLDGEAIAFVSNADIDGGNPERNDEIFLFDGQTMRQVTSSNEGHSAAPSLDRGLLAFHSNADLTGQNPDGNSEIFLFDGSRLRQITDTTGSAASFSPSLDAGSIAFASDADLTGENPEGNSEIFLYDGTSIVQVTHGTGISRGPSLDGHSIAFHSSSDLTGENPDGNFEIFLFDGTGFHQVTDVPTEVRTSHLGSRDASLDGGRLAFLSNADLTGENPDEHTGVFLWDGSSMAQVAFVDGVTSPPQLEGGAIAFASTTDPTGGQGGRTPEIFYFDGASVTQVTSTPGVFTTDPSLDGHSIAFRSSADLTGENPTESPQVFLASCVPTPPEGPFSTSPEVPGFRFKVRITAGGEVFAGEQEESCLGETLCVSGALPGRSELFLRIIGPRPNGFLWLNLVRFTPSQVEVWAEQTSSGTLNYYDLPALPRQDVELTGLVDKQAFMPEGAVVVQGGEGPRSFLERMLLPIRSRSAALAASTTLPAPRGATFTSPVFPGYRFTVRVVSGEQELPVTLEDDCLPETLCVSGALPGRSELFLRLIGPRPNGYFWVNLVRFTTSRIEVEIEQVATGERRVYVLDQVPRQSDELPGRVDREAFLPE